ncbi:MAG TPA: phytoene/squalene synthase family protein [Tepidisphaeraceae bacterium]|nr:phytoene/squalene synthase family protein [Tepidisphaeraceae bacterium]
MTTDISSTRGGELAVSRQYCKQITRQQARNFYYGLMLLAEPKRSALFALYAYMRQLDDLADEEDGRSQEQRLADLDNFKRLTHAVFAGRVPDEGPADLWPAFADMVHTYELPLRIFDDAILGQRQDVLGTTFQTFDELYEYCYRVAGTVGLASVYIWGFEGGEKTETLAIERGVALQLTNILRDLSEDACRGRVYLSADDLTKFNLTATDVLSRTGGQAFKDLVHFEIERAENYFERSKPLEKFISADCRATLNAMTNIYHKLLEKIAADPQRVLQQRISLSMVSKIMIALEATWLGS